MGKRGVRIIVVPRWLSIALLVIVMAAMVALIYFLSGRAYAGAGHSLLSLTRRVVERSGPTPSRGAFLAALMPTLANAMLFMPFGFLAFMVLDRPARRRGRTYLLTFVAALVFAAAVSAWQEWLPTRVTAYPDVLSNAAGALVGAAFAHVRKEVRIGFEI